MLLKYSNNLSLSADIQEMKLGLLIILLILSSILLNAQEAAVFSKPHPDGSILFGMQDSSGKILLAPFYKRIDKSPNDCLYVVTRKEHLGVFSLHDSFIIPIEFDEIIFKGKSLIVTEKDRKTAFYSSKGELILGPDRFDPIIYYTSFVLVNGRKMGAISYQGHIMLPLEFDYIGLLKQGKLVVKQNGKYFAVWMKDGSRVDERVYDGFKNFNGDLARIELDGKYGYINRNWKEVVPPVFDEIMPFVSNRAEVRKGEHWGIINSGGEYIIEPQYDDIKLWPNGYAGVKIKRRWGIIDLNGKELIPAKYRVVGYISPTKLGYWKRKKWAVFDINTRQKTEHIFNYVSWFTDTSYLARQDGKYYEMSSTFKKNIRVFDDYKRLGDGIYAASKNSKWAILGANRQELTAYRFDHISPFGKNWYSVMEDGEQFLWKPDGSFIGPFHFDHFYPFSQGYSRVSRDGFWGMIDETGNTIVPLRYDFIESYQGGFVKVKKNGLFTMVDKNGEEVCPPRYDEIALHPQDLGLFRIWHNGLQGLLDTTGIEVVSPKYYDIRKFKGEIAIVVLKKGDKWIYGAINRKGVVMIPIIYDRIEFREDRILAIKGDDVDSFGLNGIRTNP